MSGDVPSGPGAQSLMTSHRVETPTNTNSPLEARAAAVRSAAADPVRVFRSDDSGRLTGAALPQIPARGHSHFLHNTNK